MPLRRFGRPGLIGTAARTAVIVGTAGAVSGAVQNRQARAVAPTPLAPPPMPPDPVQQGAMVAPPAGGDLIAQLEQAAQLHAAGILSDAEFSAAKAKLLS